MHRIDHPTAAAVLPTPGAAGTPGFFTKGNPLLAVPATRVTADFLNAVQEELSNLVEGGGLVLDKGARDQVLQAVVRIADASGYANLAINPQFTITQRAGLVGTTADSTEKFLTADRWQFKAGGAAETATVTPNVAIDLSAEQTPSRANRMLEFNKATGGSSGVKPTIATRLENIVQYGGRPVVFAFDARKGAGSNFTLDGLEAVQDFGTGGGASADVVTQLTALGSLLVDGTWRRYVFTGVLPATTGKTITTGHHVVFRLRLPANTALELRITAVTVQRTSRDPGFLERHDQVERLLCCRYFEVEGAAWNNAASRLRAYWNTADDFNAGENPLRTMNARFRSQKRLVVPTVTWYSRDGLTTNAVTEGASTDHSVQAASFERQDTHTGFPDFVSPPAAGLRLFEARYVADAELV